MAVTINGTTYQSTDREPVKARKRPPPQRAAAHRDRTKYDRKRIKREEQP